MDFIDGLPNSNGKTTIFAVVDYLSKVAHFIPISHPYTATSVAQIFLNHVFKLYGIPKSIVCDRYPVFTSVFWKELAFNYLSAYHPQIDGQTEVVNRTIEIYLKCFSSDRPKEWAHWIVWAEYHYNTSLHTTTKKTPYEVVNGRAPPTLLSYIPGITRVESVDWELQDRDQVLKQLRKQL
ncbi:hypothetical protein AMTRI_Chr02g260530 [Amborella trichopoda]